MFVDLPPHLHERVVCSISAAAKFEIPTNIMLAVAEQEGGRPGQWVRNKNGTHDVGALQFNTAYLAELSRFGIKTSDVAAAGCYAYDLAAWRLQQHLKNDSGDLWTRAANYHSRTPVHNSAYRARLIQKGGKWSGWLSGRFAHGTVPVQSVRAASFSRPAASAMVAVEAAARARLRPGGIFFSQTSKPARDTAGG